MIEVKFIKSPSCKPFYLAYSAGDVGRVTKEMAKQLEKEGFIEATEKPKATPKKSTVKK